MVSTVMRIAGLVKDAEDDDLGAFFDDLDKIAKWKRTALDVPACMRLG